MIQTITNSSTSSKTFIMLIKFHTNVVTIPYHTGNSIPENKTLHHTGTIIVFHENKTIHHTGTIIHVVFHENKTLHHTGTIIVFREKKRDSFQTPVDLDG